jgi:hypothetical protein
MSAMCLEIANQMSLDADRTRMTDTVLLKPLPLLQ